VDDADTAAVHIQLRTDDGDAVHEPEPRPTDAANYNHASLQLAPVCGGYIVVGPDTFGCIDDASGLFAGIDSGVQSGHVPQRLHDEDMTLASDSNLLRSDLAAVEDSHQQPTKETVSVNDRTGVTDASTVLPTVENGVQGNIAASDSAPVTNYAVIVGVNNNELGHTERCSLDNAYVGQSDSLAESTDRAAGDLRPSRSVSEEEDVAVPFGVSGPPVGYSLNSGGYLSHSELLGAAPAV